MHAPLALVLALASCRSGPQVIDRHLGTIRSWVATVQMVAERSAAGAVPRAYAVRTLATAADEIEAEVAAAAVAAEAASDAEITRQSHELASRVRRMSGEIEQGKPVEREGKVLDTSLERLASRIRRRVNAR